ncbi:MAG: radical SAM protein [Anaerolineaceae bacterium]|nr:radical SAM protein [Anaerolineaceae bacterium]
MLRAKPLLNLMGDRLHTLPLIVLYLTDGCNSQCVTCDIWRNPRRNMSLALVDTLVDACQELQVRWLLLSGGEAMQHPHWPEIAQRFRESGVYVMLLTNGLLLRKQADAVIASVDEVIVSLDAGTAETYHAIRGVNAFDLVLDGIRAVRAGGLPVVTRTTVQRGNYQEIPQIIASAKAADVTRISFLTVDVSNTFAFGPRFTADASLPVMTPADHSPLMTALTPNDVRELAHVLDTVEARFADDFASGLIAESPPKMRRMVDYFAAINRESDFPRPRCNAPHINVVVEVDGTLRPCYFLPAFGQLHPQPSENGQAVSLKEAVNTDAAQALRQAYRSGARPECERCVCPLYKGPRSLLRM